jgi:hypothetical protein
MLIVTADRLQILYDRGHTCCDTFGSGEDFIQRVRLFAIGGDYPGLGKLTAKQTANATYGCIWCLIKGKHDPALSKVCYPDHRAFLRPDHPFRFDQRWGIMFETKGRAINHGRMPVRFKTACERSVRAYRKGATARGGVNPLVLFLIDLETGSFSSGDNIIDTFEQLLFTCFTPLF